MQKISYTLVAWFLIFHALTAQDQPNIIWLVSEDNSKHFLRLYEESGAAMLAVEALAKEGIVFRNAFSQAPVCSVARSTLISGCYAPRIGAQYHRREALVPAPEGLQMFPSYLREAGYYTSNNSKEDYNIIKSEDAWDESSRTATYKNRGADQPFFHVQNFGVTHEGRLHFPLEDVQEKPTRTDPDQVDVHEHHPTTELFKYTYARYHDLHKQLDEQIANFVQQLQDDGVYEDAIIFYYGDHGGVLPGSKGYLYERGVHVPLLVRVPTKWQHLVSVAPGSSVSGFVRFIDFGPTVLNLAGVSVPERMDGKAFLGPNVSLSDLESRKEVFCYADRFDEKYDFVRSLRRGKFKYIRNYQPFNIDGLQNNYRYIMQAYEEWRALFLDGKLTDEQAQFFLPRPAEALYDVEADPFELRNLAHEPGHQAELESLRHALQNKVSSLPDMSFIPEPIMVREGIKNPVQYGQDHKDDIARYIELVDLALGPMESNQKRIRQALKSRDALDRYWTLVACSSRDAEAPLFLKKIKKIAAKDKHNLVRLRALEFLGLHGTLPMGELEALLERAADPIEANLILNTITLLRDGKGHEFDLNWEMVDPAWVENKRSNVTRRLSYLVGEKNTGE